ncbi:MAG: hypothetical protein L0206_18260, partial [Actinobacteria bacterium]|nr:hypothetical protein [Actinomycetota bacterium]
MTTTPLQFCEGILDHFKCYSASPDRDFERIEVELTDQFGAAAALLRRPYRFCNPVDKNAEGIRDSTAH